MRKSRFLFLIAALGGAWAFQQHVDWRAWLGRDSTILLTEPDVGSTGHAAKVESVQGNVFTKVNGATTQVRAGTQVSLGSTFQVDKGALVQLLTEGNWIVALEDGEFAFEDARTDAARSVRSGTWIVSKGRFRAKPHDYAPGNFRLEVRTPAAKLIVGKGEIGLSLPESGRGQVWLMSGEARIVWSDGRTKALNPKGMEYL